MGKIQITEKEFNENKKDMKYLYVLNAYYGSGILSLRQKDNILFYEYKIPTGKDKNHYVIYTKLFYKEYFDIDIQLSHKVSELIHKKLEFKLVLGDDDNESRFI